MGISLTLHVLSIVIWVGGMFFAYMILRPVAAAQLEPPVRLKLWRQIFERFFPWVWVAIILAPLTGVMLTSPYGGFGHSPVHIHIMTTLGSIMVGIFLHVYFVPFKKLKRHLDESDIPAAAKNLNQIRLLVGMNTILGGLTIITATAGKYYLS